MGDFLGAILHQGMVRVLSVPVAMVLMLVVLYRRAQPPPWHEDDDKGGN